MKRQRWITTGIALVICCGYFTASGQTTLAPLQGRAMKTATFLSFSEKYRHAPITQEASSAPKILLSPVMHLTEDYYFRHCGYFCHLEIVTQKKLGIPLTFRLGDLRYVDRLEGKDR